ncbi:MAG: HigA family addiction module antidote protein [Ignavibacteriae bacterium]|nr:HigA family addiction module antidote protein [Ignavibacteriota bacterium]
MGKTFENEYAPTTVSHPGMTLKETLDALGMSQRELAKRMGRPLKTINEIVNGKTWITPETALQLETVLGVPANFWLKRQNQYDESLARKKQSQELVHHIAWAKSFPLKEMNTQFGLPLHKDKVEQARQLLMYFGVASPTQWQDYWNIAAVNYRKSIVFAAHTEALSAWLRQGEIQAQRIRCEDFDAKKLKTALGEIRFLSTQSPEVFQPRLRELCASCGVAHVLVPELPKTRVCGATRWLTTKKAVLQQSLRYKWSDQFWFTFFHEAAHLILHNEDLILEIADGARDKKEEEANRFAMDTLIPPDDFNNFVASGDFTERGVKIFARRAGILPAIVVGRLQYERDLQFNQLNGLRQRFQWAHG